MKKGKQGRGERRTGLEEKNEGKKTGKRKEVIREKGSKETGLEGKNAEQEAEKRK
jgi:hypothetical protein